MATVPSIPRIPSIPSVGGVGGGVPYALQTLTFTGGLITDAVRAAGVEGDGLPIPGGVGIWPPATNLATQSVPGTLATTGVTKAGDAAATLTKVTDATAPFQASSTDVWLLDNSAGSTDATVDFDGNATAAAHTGSVWAKKIAGSPTVSIEGGGTPTAITGTASYGRYAQSRTATAGDNLRVTAPAGAVVRFTAGQLETGSIATPFIATDGSTATRAAGRVQIPVSGLLTATQGAVACRIVPEWTALPNGSPMIFSWINTTDNRIECYVNNTETLNTIRQSAAVGAAVSGGMTTVSQGTPITGVFSWTATQVGVSADGAAFTTAVNTSIPTLTDPADIGTRSGTVQFDGRFLWFATFAGTLTDADAAALNAFGDTPPTWAQIKGALPATVQLTSLWKAVDDGYERVV